VGKFLSDGSEKLSLPNFKMSELISVDAELLERRKYIGYIEMLQPCGTSLRNAGTSVLS